MYNEFAINMNYDCYEPYGILNGYFCLNFDGFFFSLIHKVRSLNAIKYRYYGQSEIFSRIPINYNRRFQDENKNE